MDTNTQSVLKNARTVHTVGPRNKELRPATKVISGLIKLGFFAGLVFVAWKGGAALLSSNSTSEDRAIKVASLDESDITVENLKPKNSRIRTEADRAQSGEIITVLPEVTAVLDTKNITVANSTHKLAIDVKHTDTAPELAVKMWRAGQEFQAAALQAEGLELQPYYIEGDSTQPTIGVGYNIKMSINTVGRESVRSELKQAGVDDPTITQLMDSRQSVSSQAKITVPQALALLDVATHRFRDSTRTAVGASAYDKLPTHRQAALMWIDYNSNIHRRPQLLHAVRSNQTHQAIEEMETWITVHGKRIRSPNIVLAQAMYWSKDGLQQVVMNPSKIKRDAANNIVMWQPTPTAPSVAPVQNSVTTQAAPSVPAQTNIHVTAGTVHTAPNQEVLAQQVAARTRTQLAGLRNLRSAPPSEQPQMLQPEEQTSPSGPEHQSSNSQRHQWLNARNVRQSSEEPTSNPTQGIR